MKVIHKLYKKILKEGYTYTDKSRDVKMTQLSSYQIEFDLTKGFPAVTTKKLYWKGVVGELLWFLRGDTNIKYLVDNGINIWNKDAYNWYSEHYNTYYPDSKQNKFTLDEFVSRIKKAPTFENLKDFQSLGISLGDLGRVYSAQWREWQGHYTFDMKEHRFIHGGSYPTNIRHTKIDQISNLIKNLKENPMSRRHIVTAWNPAELDDMALPPCHWSFEVIVEPLTSSHKGVIINFEKGTSEVVWEEPKYSFTLKWHQRSVDSFLGLPFNIASYALLAHIIGKLTNMVPKTLIGDLSNVHIYENHIDAVKEQLTRKPYELPQLDNFRGMKMGMHNNFDSWLNSLEISDFKLKNYKHHPAIQADMIAPKN